MDSSYPRESRPPRVAAVVPARWASVRFPGKPLCELAGKPLIQWVWERCASCQLLDEIIVATDDERIASVAQGFGAIVVMTRSDHPSGTDRIAEALSGFPDCEIVINVQGDEPLIDPGLIDALVERMREEDALDMVTAAHPVHDEASLEDPNIVKVVLDERGRALYFSRSPIPFVRNRLVDWTPLRHKGIYGYRRAFLERFVQWPPGTLEQLEGLEQLRALEHGASISVVLTDDESIGVDTPEQARIVESQLPSG